MRDRRGVDLQQKLQMPTDLQLGRHQASGLVDVLDRVLDKGIVIDAWVRVSLVGIDLITVEARVVVASIDTYLKYSEAVGQTSAVAGKQIDTRTHEALSRARRPTATDKD